MSKRFEDGYKNLIKTLKSEKIETWFDMSLFLDKIKDEKREMHISSLSFESFKRSVKSGVAFITFDYGVDGVSIEIAKYAKAFENILKTDGKKGKGYPTIHCVGGYFSKEADLILKDRWNKVAFQSIMGFGAWDGYNEYFNIQLARGSEEYNLLARKIWSQTVQIALELGELILENKIGMLFPVNASSNPGNVSLSFALALVSELMDIPVLASHHDFYWEDGKRKKERALGEKPGLRDQFFKNSHIGEVFSLVDHLYPWDGKQWLHTIINGFQKTSLISKFGFNPTSMHRIPTSIDLRKYRVRDENEKADIVNRLNIVFAGDKKRISTRDVFQLPRDATNIGKMGMPLFLGYEGGVEVNIKQANLLFLQPTRIIKRKRIELDFKIIELLVKQDSFKNFFIENSQLTITMLVSGPIANGHDDYFNYLLQEFRDLLEGLPEGFRRRVFLAFTFGLENKEELNSRELSDLKIHEIYSISSMVLLPSKTEGRGLPIIESCATGVPILCSRYTPEYVYSDVIGESLDESLRLNVFEFSGTEFTEELLERVAEIFINPHSEKEMELHNREVVKRRYSKTTLIKSLERAIFKLWTRSKHSNKIEENVRDAFRENKKRTQYNAGFSELVLSENRKYIPGYTQLEFMVMLKALIDPSSFRQEERELRSRVMLFAESLIDIYFKLKSASKVPKEDRIKFFKHIDFIFEYHRGTDPLAIDHSLSYRHRNRRHYPYRKLTEQELCGIVGILFRKVFSSSLTPFQRSRTLGHFKDLKSSILQLMGTTEERIAINDIERLIDDLRSGKSVAIFLGHYYENEIKIFVYQVLKERLGLPVDHDLVEDDLTKEKIAGIAPVTVFVRKEPLNDISYDSFIHWIEKKAFRPIKLLYDAGLFKVVEAMNLSAGVHLAQLGTKAMKEMLAIKSSGGFVVSSGKNSFMLDMVDMTSYRLGKVGDEFFANFMDINIGDCFIQWVPAALKPSLAYPTPVQTPAEFSRALNGDLFKRCVEMFGEDEVLSRLHKDADLFGNPVEELLQAMLDVDKVSSPVQQTKINGLHEDGLPWTGAYVKVPMNDINWKFFTAFSGRSGKTVLTLIDEYQKETKEEVSFAWNGGYILNNELVGKLGLSEEYIGSPLGYLCKGGEVLSLPLYNKATFIIDKSGKISLKRVSLSDGLEVRVGSDSLVFCEEHRNSTASDKISFFDLLSDIKTIPGKDRVIYRFASNRIIERIDDSEDEVEIVPVGLTLSLPKDRDVSFLKVGSTVEFNIHGFEDVVDAIEAGPMLLLNGKKAINMEIEGWKTDHSIATQAARLDYLDMRGPKIGAGITKSGDLIVIAINGRIRESVGATHIDLAEILKEKGATSAMGFDPGGSVTLVVNERQLNISPYNKDYEDNIYTLPPSPRVVGNAILGIMQ